MMTKNIHSDFAIAPGEYLLEVLEELGMSQTELSQRMGRPQQMINEIIKGSKVITPETALQLEMVVGVPANVWTGLEAEYQLIKAKLSENTITEEEKCLLQELPVKDLMDEGFIAHVKENEKKVTELRRFFGVASLNNINKIGVYKPAFRCSKAKVPSPLALTAWLRAAEIQAKEVKTEEFDRSKLRENLSHIRQLSRQSPDKFLSALLGYLAQSGVALIVLPHFTKTYAHGAAFFPKAKKAVLLLSIRGKWADIFWFSLFHELGHLILHDKRKTYITFDHDSKEPVEQEADCFAEENLIPPKDYEQLIRETPSRMAVEKFAENQGIDPGIVIGRLQHDGHWPMNNHSMRKKYEWAK